MAESLADPEPLPFRRIDKHATIRRGLSLASPETKASPSASGPSQSSRVFFVEGTEDVELGDFFFYYSDATTFASFESRMLYVAGTFRFVMDAD